MGDKKEINLYTVGYREIRKVRKRLRENVVIIGIDRDIVRGASVDYRMSVLAPLIEDDINYKNGVISYNKFSLRYCKTVLSKLSAEDVYNEIEKLAEINCTENVVIASSMHKYMYSQRRLVVEWLNKNIIHVKIADKCIKNERLR